MDSYTKFKNKHSKNLLALYSTLLKFHLCILRPLIAAGKSKKSRYFNFIFKFPADSQNFWSYKTHLNSRFFIKSALFPDIFCDLNKIPIFPTFREKFPLVAKISMRGLWILDFFHTMLGMAFEMPPAPNRLYSKSYS